MLLSLIAPLLFSSALYTAPPPTKATVETQEVHKEVHRPKDPTILSSVYDATLGYNCVELVRTYRHDIPSMDASQAIVRTHTAIVGAVGKMYYGNSGLWHLFYVKEVHDETLVIVDGNYDEGYITTRVVPRYDPRYEGYL
jgi:hypothetical protein